jgi:hypothetical protein
VRGAKVFQIMLLAVLLSPHAHAARATGSIGMETTGFLQHADGRADSSTTFLFNQKVGTETRGNFDAQLDLKVITFMSDRSSFTAELGDSYISTGENFSLLHEFTLGRRNYDWSVSDQVWKTGLFSNRFMWDPVRPEVLGLTGAFYKYQSQNFRVLAFASPIAVPERGLPMRQVGGSVTSPSPDWIPLYEELRTFGQTVDIQYTVNTPSISKLIANPGAGASLRYGENQGFWTSVTTGFLPMQQINIAAEFGLDSSNNILNASLNARVLYHNLNTFEAGYRVGKSHFWTSVTREIPLPSDPVPANWITSAIGPSWISSFGASHQFNNRLQMGLGYIVVNESKPTQQDAQLASFLPKRFQYTRATQLTATFMHNDRLTSSGDWRYDFDTNSQLISINMNYRVGTNWNFSFGADGFISSTSTGFLGQYQGYDRVRAGVKYVF